MDKAQRNILIGTSGALWLAAFMLYLFGINGVLKDSFMHALTVAEVGQESHFVVFHFFSWTKN